MVQFFYLDAALSIDIGSLTRDSSVLQACLQRLLNITQSVEKIERLLGIHSGDTNTESATYTGYVKNTLVC